jgi:Tfp pilus assembly protein PilE
MISLPDSLWMTAYMIKLRTLVLSTCITLVACDREQTSPKATTPSIPQGAPKVTEPATPAIPPLAKRDLDNRISAPAWLRERMPADALAYVRIPSLWGLVSAPKGSVLAGGLNSKANVDAVVGARAALGKNIGNDGMKLNPVARILLQHLVSPIEAVVLKPADGQLMAANVLATARLDLKTLEEVNALFESAGEKRDDLSLARPITKEQPGVLQVGKLPLLMRFDAKNQRMFLLGGMAPDATLLDKAAAMPKQEPLMWKQEQQIDASGQGLLAWVNAEQLMPMLSGMMPPEQMSQLKMAGFDKFKRVAIGTGVAGGKGRLSLLLDAPGLSLVSMLMAGDADVPDDAANDLSLKASGSPRTVAVLRLPNRTSVNMAITTVKMSMKSGELASFDEAHAALTQYLGFEPTELLDVFGQELVIFSDELSEYMALAVRDDAKFDALLEKIKANGTKIEARKKAGVTITHAAVPPTWSKAILEETRKQPKNNDLPPQLLGMLERVHSHYYWTREGRYLVFSAVPQDLMDRARYPRHVAIGEWLKETQKQPGEPAVVQLSTRFEDVPRKFYYVYLQGLAFIAEMVGSDFDLFSMPTAQELQLPDEGAYGLRITAGESQYLVEMTYENNPVEFLANQSMSTLAVVGILAAVAVPAYQDYLVRAAITEGLAEAEPVRGWVAEMYARNQRFPNAQEINDHVPNMLQSYSERVSSIMVSPDEGSIVVALQGHSKIDDNSVILEPTVGALGNLEWQCKADVFLQKYLPASCR